MSGRQGQHRNAIVPRVGSAKVIGTGVAGVAAAFALAPMAHAGTPATPVPSAQPAGVAPSGAAQAPAARAAVTPAAVASTTTSAQVTPDYGYQKFRVGVQLKDGMFPQVPTAGTVFSIVETGPNADDSTVPDTCTTVADTGPDATKTFCVDNVDLVRRAAAEPADAVPSNQQFEIQPQDTVTITQSTVVEGRVVKDPRTVTIAPCEIPADSDGECKGTDGNELNTDAIFTDTGIPPVAVNDDAGTHQADSGPVQIVVLKNDTAHAPVTDLQVTTAPEHGTAVVKAALHAELAADAAYPGATTIIYTPAAGFSGTDRFRYTLTTANGSASALVTIRVVAAPTSATPTTPAPTTPAPTTPPSSGPIANTGTPTGELLEIALGLLVAGAAAGVAGRRVHRGRHTA